mmetsp:Transcript_29323/g.98159  ORF Transcript_29323/g.98159 Transcript_29323/m.98159 type:complete len:226 (-) Transcript_29323:5-682(-)
MAARLILISGSSFSLSALFFSSDSLYCAWSDAMRSSCAFCDAASWAFMSASSVSSSATGRSRYGCRSASCFLLHLLSWSTVHAGPSVFANFFIALSERSPSYFSPSWSGGLKYLIVGYPSTPNFSHRGLPPSVVQSTSPMITFLEFSNSSPSSSQSGFIFLQCPHQGARNLMKAALPDLNTRRSKFFSVSSTASAETPARAQNSTRLRSIACVRLSIAQYATRRG